MTYGIIGAMDSEITLLTQQMQTCSKDSKAGLIFYCGTLCEQSVVIVKCGVGKVNAAACAQMLIDLYAVDALINVGVAGGVSSSLRVLDVVVGEKLVQHDFDLTPFGYTKGFLGSDFGSDNQHPTYFEADPTLVQRCVKAAQEAIGDDHTCHTGVIASGDEFVAGSSRREAISNDFDALAAEMEGASIAQVASLNKVPFLVLRTISDLADGSAPVSFETVVQFAADTAAAIILRMLQEKA